MVKKRPNIVDHVVVASLIGLAQRSNRRAAQFADREFMLYLRIVTALGTAAFVLRSVAHLEFLAGMCLGAAIVVALVAERLKRARLASGAWDRTVFE
ncbi:MAG: hypothetical protein NVSMB19_26740 [Vulcanimicrobiaceae bacterium]